VLTGTLYELWQLCHDVTNKELSPIQIKSEQIPTLDSESDVFIFNEVSFQGINYNYKIMIFVH
jgi:hypothetical protein